MFHPWSKYSKQIQKRIVPSNRNPELMFYIIQYIISLFGFKFLRERFYTLYPPLKVEKPLHFSHRIEWIPEKNWHSVNQVCKMILFPYTSQVLLLLMFQICFIISFWSGEIRYRCGINRNCLSFPNEVKQIFQCSGLYVCTYISK